jgi:hypothetical protein
VAYSIAGHGFYRSPYHLRFELVFERKQREKIEVKRIGKRGFSA